MQKLWLVPVAMMVVGAAMSGIAQTNCLSTASNVTPDEIENWLRSGDSFMIAWGAYFAGESHDDGVVTTMVQLVERGIPNTRVPVSGKYAACTVGKGTGRYTSIDAMGEILDALIKRKEQVPPEALAAIAAKYPAQAIILASRLPVARATPLLEKWYYAGQIDGRSRIHLEEAPFERAASMLMAKDPPAGFAADVLTRSEGGLIVTVTNEETQRHEKVPHKVPDKIVVRGCEDELGGSLPEGWPPLVQYAIEENKSRKDADYEEDHVLVEAGGDRLTYRRAPVGMFLGVCNFRTN